MGESLRSKMPALYRPWLPALFDAPAVVEARATCDDCAMCDKGGDPAALRPGFFRPDVKCCSYHPTLPNFLVGAALRDASPEGARGRARLSAKIAGRTGVTPTWLASPRRYLVLYDAARESSFGRSEALLCPYFAKDSGDCTVWPFREAICATFFCKHTSGAASHAFWKALRDYLGHVEVVLGRYAATKVRGTRPPPDLPRKKLTREDIEGKPPADDDYAALWGPSPGGEEAFYVACAEAVEALSPDDTRAIAHDGEGQRFLRDLTAKHAALVAPRLAERLVLNEALRASPLPGGVGVTSYSVYDPLFLTQDLYDALSLFRADETVSEVRRRLSAEHDVELSEELVLEMQQHGVLTPPSP